MTNNNNGDRIHYLLLRYLNRTSTHDEERELSGYISKLKADDLFREIESSWKDFRPSTTLSKKKSQSILNHILKEEKVYRPKMRNRRTLIRSLAVAASIAILLSISVFFNWHTTGNRKTLPQIVLVEAADIPHDTPVNYNRNLTLPDGSKVVLQGNSTIRYLHDFSENTREITLEGQAYFDITPNPQKPFIIHTGSVKTTVLGTAFNIKALSNEKDITVSVTKGKVRVEDKNRILAILTVNQELHYTQAHTDVKDAPEIAEKTVTDWTKQDMNFDHVPLKHVAQQLSKRYGVNIEISGLELATAEIVSSFSGTESLEDILKILCAINSKTRYEIKDEKNIIISNNEY
jgi:ferric-dicitrate binding protein FerR (iron transport regulator)